MKRILGLDISSTTIGYCLLLVEGHDIKISVLDHFKPIKKGTLLERLADTRDKMSDIISHLQPDFIAIEDIITFMPRRSSANTIIILAVFNRMMGLLCLDYLGKLPTLYPVMTIRKGLKENLDPPKKEEMPALIGRHLKIPFPWEFNKNGKPRVENYDRADAAAVALFHSYILFGLLKLPPKKKKKPKKRKIK